MNLQEAMNPTIDDAIKYYKNMIFPQDMSAHTLRAVAMNKLVIKALQEKAARAAPENKAVICPLLSDAEVKQPCLEGPCPAILNEPLTVEQLRKMDGEPVWIVEAPDWGHWELSADAEDYLCDRDPDFYNMKMRNDPEGRYGLHALGWLAYARKPEGNTSECNT